MENNISPYMKTYNPKRENLLINNIEKNYFNNNQIPINNLNLNNPYNNNINNNIINYYNNNNYNLYNTLNPSQSYNFFPMPIFQTFINLPIYQYPFISLFPENNKLLPYYSHIPLKEKTEEKNKIIKTPQINKLPEEDLSLKLKSNKYDYQKDKKKYINPFWKDEEPIKKEKIRKTEIWKNELLEQIKEKKEKASNKKKDEEDLQKLEEYKFEEYIKYKNKQNLEQEEKRKKMIEERRAKLEYEAMKNYEKNKNKKEKIEENTEEEKIKDEENKEKNFLLNADDDIRVKYLYQKVINNFSDFQDLINDTFDKAIDNTPIDVKKNYTINDPFEVGSTFHSIDKHFIDRDKVYERIKTKNIHQKVSIDKNKFDIPFFFNNNNENN